MASVNINLPESSTHKQSFSLDKVPKVAEILNRKSASSPASQSTPNQQQSMEMLYKLRLGADQARQNWQQERGRGKPSRSRLVSGGLDAQDFQVFIGKEEETPDKDEPFETSRSQSSLQISERIRPSNSATGSIKQSKFKRLGELGATPEKLEVENLQNELPIHVEELQVQVEDCDELLKKCEDCGAQEEGVCLLKIGWLCVKAGCQRQLCGKHLSQKCIVWFGQPKPKVCPNCYQRILWICIAYKVLPILLLLAALLAIILRIILVDNLKK